MRKNMIRVKSSLPFGIIIWREVQNDDNDANNNISIDRGDDSENAQSSDETCVLLTPSLEIYTY